MSNAGHLIPPATANKLMYFYFNKYVVTPFSRNKYFLSYDFNHKALWYRVFKVASRTIDHHLRENCEKGEYIYSSEVGYNPGMFRDFFKFAFVRNPETRLLSAWKDKVLRSNYFKFRKKEHEQMKVLDNFIAWVKDQDIQTCDEHLRAQSTLIDLNHIDFVGRFESFDRDFAFVAEKIGLENYDAAQLNQTSGTAHLTMQQRIDIAEIYRKDFQIFYPEEIKILDDVQKEPVILTS